jgi:ubiquinone/menaquinone biosynthesis C-methylase UbiE
VVWNERLFYELVAVVANGRRWLDLGCGRGVRGAELLQVRRRTHEVLYIGIDPHWDSLRDDRQANRVCGLGQYLPFRDSAFDVVTSDMVFEHVADPVRVLKECHRVLNDEGVLVVHTASSWHYILLAGRVLSKLISRRTYVRMVSRFTGREERDIFPTRYAANTSRSFAKAAREAGFEGGIMTHLGTPFSTSARIERLLYPVIPQALKSTLLAVYFKRQWMAGPRRCGSPLGSTG